MLCEEETIIRGCADPFLSALTFSTAQQLCLLSYLTRHSVLEEKVCVS